MALFIDTEEQTGSRNDFRRVMASGNDVDNCIRFRRRNAFHWVSLSLFAEKSDEKSIWRSSSSVARRAKVTVIASRIVRRENVSLSARNRIS